MLSFAAAGFTLAELLVVVTILATLAGIAIHAASDASAQAAQTATQAQLSAIRQAIFGQAGGAAGQCYKRDCGALPAGVSDLLVRPASVPAFDPTTGFGWRGPYLLVPHAMVAGLPQVLDGWGKPIVLQFPDLDGNSSTPPTPDDVRHGRLVSPGPNGFIESPLNAWFPSMAACLDDVVLYLQVADVRS